MTPEKTLAPEQRDELLRLLQARFAQHANRHPNLQWAEVRARLMAHEARLWSLQQMEASGGEPDVVGHDAQTGEYLFCDCAAESPAGRRSLCYDLPALESRKDHPPVGNAVDAAAAMGIELLTEAQYRELQRLGRFDAKTSSWLLTPAPIRQLGGALFGDYRYGQTFVYHNGAASYYAARGFRGMLRV
ncbi:DUF4256 domain-containing protein [Hymenobacter sp. B81]|uniref:DUF4256 domain-containing protein n=1 Tax=Hymenobacter sp. B81 TaxID=3344878 RepID=UPI0037DD027D